MERQKTFTVKTLENEDVKGFEGYLSTFGNADRVGDVIEDKAFEESVKKSNVVPMLFNHDRNQVIGKMELSTDEKGLFVKGSFLPNNSKAQEVYEMLKFGALNSMSVGMAVNDYEPVEKSDPWGAWLIKSAEVLEGSVVTVPANEQAVVTNVKQLDDETHKELEALKAKNKKLELQLKINEFKEVHK